MSISLSNNPLDTNGELELMCRIFGDYMYEGFVIIKDDDLHVCGNTVLEVRHNWSLVLFRLQQNNLTLSAKKTIVCPVKTTILGWIWNSGTLTPSTHKVAPLASVEPPKTATSMRSFLGAYKAISRCIPKYASLLSPLEDFLNGLQGAQKIRWSPELLDHFKRAQNALKDFRTLTIPIPSDMLVMTVDASLLNKGLAATLFSCRNEKRHISGFYSFKLKSRHQTWLPFELEALAITAAVEHFSPYIRESPVRQHCHYHNHT